MIKKPFIPPKQTTSCKTNTQISLEKIKSDLYSAISLKVGENQNLDIIVSDIANHYYTFKKIIKDIFKNKLSFEFKEDKIAFNSIIFPREGGKKIYFNYSSFRKVFEQRSNSLFFSGSLGFYDTSIKFYPTCSDGIKIFTDPSIPLVIDNITILEKIEKIKTYIYADLMIFNNLYSKEMVKLNSFILNFSKIIFLLEKNGFSTKKLFEEHKQYKKIDLYKILNESKDIVYLHTDNDISKNLKKLTENLKIKTR